MEIIFSVCSVLGVGGIFSFVVQRKLKEMEAQAEAQKVKQQAIEKGVQALLRAQIISLYNKYMDRGEIPIYERENLEHLYTEYKALGGNGVIESLMEKLRDLPTPK